MILSITETSKHWFTVTWEEYNFTDINRNMVDKFITNYYLWLFCVAEMLKMLVKMHKNVKNVKKNVKNAEMLVNHFINHNDSNWSELLLPMY